MEAEDKPQKEKSVSPPKLTNISPRPSTSTRNLPRTTQDSTPSADPASIQADTISTPNSSRTIPPREREAPASSAGPSSPYKISKTTSNTPDYKLRGLNSVQQLVEKFQTPPQPSTSTPLSSPLRRKFEAEKIRKTITELERLFMEQSHDKTLFSSPSSPRRGSSLHLFQRGQPSMIPRMTTTESITTSPTTVETRPTDHLDSPDVDSTLEEGGSTSISEGSTLRDESTCVSSMPAHDDGAEMTSNQGKNVENPSTNDSEMGNSTASRSHLASETSLSSDEQELNLASGTSTSTCYAGTETSSSYDSAISTPGSSSLDTSTTTDEEIFTGVQSIPSIPWIMSMRAQTESVDSISDELETPLTGEPGGQSSIPERPRFDRTSMLTHGIAIETIPLVPWIISTPESIDSISEELQIPLTGESGRQSRIPEGARLESHTSVPTHGTDTETIPLVSSAISTRAQTKSIDSISDELEIPLTGESGGQSSIPERPRFDRTSISTHGTGTETITLDPSAVPSRAFTDSVDSISDELEIPLTGQLSEQFSIAKEQRLENRTSGMSREATSSVVPASVRDTRNLRNRPVLNRPKTPLPVRRYDIPSSGESE